MNKRLTLNSFYTLIKFDEIDSTNDELKRLIYHSSGTCEGTVVWALCQKAGKGRRGKQWFSPPGNLYFSLLLKPETSIQNTGQIGFIASNTMADIIEQYSNHQIKINLKWPNDLLIKKHKIGGILLESLTSLQSTLLLDWLIIGIGININHYPPDNPYPVTSLFKENLILMTSDLTIFLYSFLNSFYVNYIKWKKNGFSFIKDEWLQKAEGLKKNISIKLEDKIVSGYFETIDETGALILIDPNGIKHKITTGDVSFG
ncbi:MAG: biotin--[acetyl-CoA-carboxylase] ligase [Alphaproteobacteria bacterium]|nr:biotin--[acetyl-CoA-carboxylase] ligase [Alphaproteobacteria bacterium]